ncbi:hypothetical protein Syun_019258 [Stephania yunnanensis]|uniref:Protein kinase domain-containing protein n=1 Tax=Stephania yunnanensis TaxID=152371 RepID=A0AAP0ITT0_9MAGN
MKFLSNGIQRARELASQHAKLAAVAIESLFAILGQAEKEFKVEVEAIGRVRHKNLVRLLGYCMEGAYRMLVYEYIDNGNLDQWLHGDVGLVSPLTWEIRMNIILGTAKGLAYLHEGLEPKVVHRDVKSSNILLDRQWNAKVSDFGLAKLLFSERSYVTTRVMGTYGFREFGGNVVGIRFMACRNGIAFPFLIESATTFLETELIPFLFRF